MLTALWGTAERIQLIEFEAFIRIIIVDDFLIHVYVHAVEIVGVISTTRSPKHLEVVSTGALVHGLTAPRIF